MMTSNSSLSLNNEFIFECDQHAVNIYEQLQRLYGEKALFDIILIAGNDCIKIPAHKIVLSALSEYFSDIIDGDPTVSRINEVELKEINSSTLKLILDYMYSGSIELHLETIETLLKSAVFLKMKNLVDGCCDYLEKNLNSGNCLNWLCLAKELKLSGLEEKSLNLVYTHFEEVTKKSEFLNLNAVQLKDLLFTGNPYEGLEEQVFLSMVSWIKYEEVNRQDLLLELLSLVRYQYLTPKFIIKNRFAVCKSLENCELVYGWLQYHLWPESRTIEQQNLAFTAESEPIEQVTLQEEVDEVTTISFNHRNEAEIRIYNQTLRAWSVEKKSPPLLVEKTNYSMIVIGSKLFLVGGLIDGYRSSNSVECLDLKTFRLTNLPPMRIARFKSQLANVKGHLCVLGGYETSSCEKFIDSVEIFNFSTRKWRDLEQLKPNESSRIIGHEGILYILDFLRGYLHSYDISSNRETFRRQQIDHSIVDCRMVSSGKFIYIICVGGSSYFSPIKKQTYYRKTVIKRLDLSNNTWLDVAQSSKTHSLIETATGFLNKILFVEKDRDVIEYSFYTKEFKQIDVVTANACFLTFKL